MAETRSISEGQRHQQETQSFKNQAIGKARPQVVTITNNINVQQGHAFIGSVFRDNANLSHNTNITELLPQEELQAHIQQPNLPSFLPK